MKNKKTIFLFFGLIFAGFSIGIGLSILDIKYFGPTQDIVSIGDWRFISHIGSPESSWRKKSWISLHAPLALSHKEALYFGRSADEEGRILKQECDYIVSGNNPAARWWSLTIYDQDGFLPKSNTASSKNSINIQSNSNGSWEIFLSDKNHKKDYLNTLSLSSAKKFSLIFRLYGPKKALSEITPLDLPKIKLIGCTP